MRAVRGAASVAVVRVAEPCRVERLFHVKRMLAALAPVPVMASRSQTSLDSMNRRCLSMRFYDAKMGFYEL